MKNVHLCLGLSNSFELSNEEQLRLFKQVGFDGFFSGWSKKGDIAPLKKLSEELNLIYQSVHAPFEYMLDVWNGGEKGEKAIGDLINCIEDCAENNIPILVVHAIIGFELEAPSDEGLKRIERIVKKAEELNVILAFENTEGEEYLAKILNELSSYKCVKFCLDSGHEMCYNHSKDLLAIYGDKLICTHINDNLGIRDYNGKITWIDDLHLLPFDGICDFDNLAKRLTKINYNRELTFELTRYNKPNRHELDKYLKMTPVEYITEAFIRACKFANLYLKYKQ